MGSYFNPSNDGFKQALIFQIYVDKTGLIGFTNSILDTEQKFAAVSRARRFGKSMAAKLLIAYYCKGCDSRELFRGLKAETLPSFESELNKNNVITFDVQNFRSFAKITGDGSETLANIQREIIAEPENLELALWKAQRGKSSKNAVINFRRNLSQNLKF